MVGSCRGTVPRDWPPVSQVIILEEKGDWRGVRLQLGHASHQLQLTVRDAVSCPEQVSN